MDYNKIVSITGLGGLYELMGSKAEGAIVRSLEDQKTRFVSSRIHNFSQLESIEVYTVENNVNLLDVFKAMDASSESLPSDKDANAVRKYFEKVYGNIDFDRVYNSDMKKMVKWYSILKANNVDFNVDNNTETTEDVVAEESVEAPVTVTEPTPEEAPKKKASRKKKTEE